MLIIFPLTVTANQVAYLQVLIQIYHENFKKLYLDCYKTPNQCLQFFCYHYWLATAIILTVLMSLTVLS